MKIRDCYGREFEKESIKNSDLISLLTFKSLQDFSDEEISTLTVCVTDKHGNNWLYLLSELKGVLKANYYCRLEDPYMRSDMLSQIPDFRVALEFEKYSAEYNAYVLNNNKDFINLLKTYVKESLHADDKYAFKDIAKEDIRANHSKELDNFYQSISEFSEAKKAQFNSLFITNRHPFSYNKLIIFPAKWEPSYSESYIYELCLDQKYYTEYPHRNVLLADIFANPEAACMHSWAMDVLYLLLEYHIGTGQAFTLFKPNEEFGYAVEVHLRQRIIAKKLQAPKGYEARENVARAIANPIRVQLENACCTYMDHLLTELEFNKQTHYPAPAELSHCNNLLYKKYNAVYFLYASLQNYQDISDEDSIEKFKTLYEQNDRQNIIAQHRDWLGIRLLAALFSLLRFGIKNTIKFYQTNGYVRFWSSRGDCFNQDIATLLDDSVNCDIRLNEIQSSI